MADHDTNLIGINTTLVEDNADTFTRKHTQHIPQWHLDDLAEQRKASTGQREGDFMRVASIPTAVVEKWMREGFNILTDRNITGADIVKRLKAENLDAFLTTDKSI
jgi:hypothetical protein